MTADSSHKYGHANGVAARGARAARAAAARDIAPAFTLYSGSIEFLRGGQVLASTACLCKRCGPFAIPRVYGRLSARVMDPLGSQVHKLEHARPSSLGLE